MEIKLIVVGKTKSSELVRLINEYVKRINFYKKFKIIEVNSLKSKKNSEKEIKKFEGEKILINIKKNELIFLLDENGKSFNSRKFADFLSNKFKTNKSIVFVVGGAYGFSNEIKQKSNEIISLSEMTFSHQIIK